MTINVISFKWFNLSFTLTQFYVLNLVGWFGVCSNQFIIFWYTLLFYYNSSVSELFCCGFFESFVILLAILLPIKSPVAYAVFWMTLYEDVLRASVAGFWAWSRGFWLYLTLRFLLIF